MADEYRTVRSGPSVVAWLAMIIAILALILAWMAYNRAGEDLATRIREGIANVQ